MNQAEVKPDLMSRNRQNRDRLHRNRVALMGCWLALCWPVAVLTAMAVTRVQAQQNPVEQPPQDWVGKPAKPFTLPGIDGKPVHVAGVWKKHPVVLVFYRGVW